MMEEAITLDAFQAAPSIDNLRHLAPGDFDAFLVHMFELAGYQVHKDNDRHRMYLSLHGHIAALALISYGTQNKVGINQVESLREACQNARSENGLNVLGTMIARTDYADEVLAADNSDPNLVLLNGDQVLRYYRFLVGYRLDGYQYPPLTPTLMPSVDGVRHIYTERPNVLTVANNRGGIGKSTTALNLAYGLAEKGLSVLAVDLDPQANFTQMLGGHISTLASAHIGQYFSDRVDLPLLVQKTPFSEVRAFFIFLDQAGGILRGQTKRPHRRG